jgi:hypothetical protein
MSPTENNFDLPPQVEKAGGSVRRVGFEIEFSGLSVEDAAAAVQISLGGEFGEGTAAERAVHVESLGDFNVEVDWEFLKRTAADQEDQQDQDFSPKWIEQLSRAAAVILPIEVVCPPIPMTELAALNPLVDALRKAGAVGTEESLVAAYGVHINPEAPSLGAESLLAYIQAFSLLQWWLVEQHDVDTTRRMTTFIDPYPEAYLRQVLSRTEATLDMIFSDYLAHNATRNRALDLLPLLAEIDEARVRQAVDDPRIKPRPTFHYRLADCQIERPGWSLADSWGKWLVVERLAARRDALDELAASFLDTDRPVLGTNRKKWVEKVNRWIDDHGLA